jgi:DDE superfamily endonuclease
MFEYDNRSEKQNLNCRSISERFNIAKSSLSKSFFRIIRVICSLSDEILKWPGEAEIDVYKQQFKKMGGLDGVIGAIDGTYCKIEAPKKDPTAYINRKCFFSITLQAICGPTLKYTDCFVGYPSSVHDVRIFRNSDIYPHVMNQTPSYFPSNTFIVGDKAYPSLMTCVVPYKQNGRLTQAQKSFNYYHSKTRQVIERSFALLFGRFRRLKDLKMQRTELIPFVVLAACVLHNICLDFDNRIEDYVQEGLEIVQDNGDDATSSAAYGQEENSSEADAFRKSICDELYIRKRHTLDD